MSTTFVSNGVAIAYDDLRPDADRAVLLVHGFAANREENWRRTGWYGLIERKGWRLVALDCRGHGESQKPHDTAAYDVRLLTQDLLGLLDHLGIETVDAVGFSMGAGLVLRAALQQPRRFSSIVLGGVGDTIFQPSGRAEQMAAALESEDSATIEDPLARGFRIFAELQGEDRQALAACVRGPAWPLAPDDLEAISASVLVATGAKDDLAGSPEGLARRFSDGRSVTLPGCDHFSTIAHPLFKASVIDFFEGYLEDI